jgi:hypothetical protein
MAVEVDDKLSSGSRAIINEDGGVEIQDVDFVEKHEAKDEIFNDL